MTPRAGSCRHGPVVPAYYSSTIHWEDHCDLSGSFSLNGWVGIADGGPEGVGYWVACMTLLSVP